MKNSFLTALLAGAVCAAAFTTAAAQTEPTPTSKKEMKAKRKLRRQNGPDVYKGTVANERRMLTDYPGAEKDKGTTDEGSGRKGKGKKRDKTQSEAE